jgi:PTH1 family peptidyl-tRNA hydrolase
MAVDRLATSWSISLGKEKRFYGIFGEGRLSPRLASSGKIRLLKPTTYMNVSGQSVRACADWFKGNPENILVIYDDMDLPLGKLRLRPSGSAGGHNGKNDIDGAIASKANQNVTSHVLGGFSTTETKILPEIFDLAESTVTSILADGLEKAMSLYNSRSIDI